MSDNKPSTPVDQAETAVDEQGLELGLQELEALEAPGFWTGFSAGTAVVASAVASATIVT
ncbi:daptide-type RiPP [Streptomyces sp. NPDC060194]|uniref:daptide-type RiPP n=1 Tax=Streptomyces sp. NPDC060194 TaxID=3347069 RepID=UPI00364AA945